MFVSLCGLRYGDISAHQSFLDPDHKSTNSCIYLSVQTELLVIQRRKLNSQQIALTMPTTANYHEMAALLFSTQYTQHGKSTFV